MDTFCSNCGSSLTADVNFCPKCGKPTSSYYANTGALPYEPTAQAAPFQTPSQIPSTDYGSIPYGVPLQHPYELPNPYVIPLPPPPPQRRTLGLFIGLGVLVLFLVSGGVFGFLTRINPSHQAQHWYNKNYIYKKRITIDHTKVGGGSNLSNFPGLISLPANSDLRTAANGGYVQNSKGYDIIFTDSTETVKLDHEVETFNASTGEIDVWVRIPTLEASTDTVIYMYFGNSRISSSQENRTRVWDSNYILVQHLQETGICPVTFADSTSNANNGDCTNSPAPEASGIIGGSRDFNGSNTLITESKSLVQNNTVITLSIWFKTSTSGIIVGYQNAAYPNEAFNFVPILYVSTDGKLRGEFWVGPSPNPITSSGTVTDGNWHHAVLVGNMNTQSLYLDGALTNSLSGSINNLDMQYNQFGGGYFSSDWPNAGNGWSILNGSLEELRISNIVRSAGWIATEYNNQFSPSTFAIVSSATSLSSRGTGMVLLDTTNCIAAAYYF